MAGTARSHSQRYASYLGAGAIGPGGSGAALGIVASRFQAATATSGINPLTTSRRHHYAHAAGAITDLQCVETSWYMSLSGPVAGPSRKFKRYIEYPENVFHPVLWGGSLQKDVASIMGTAKSDVVLSSLTGLPLEIPAGALFYERTVTLDAAAVSMPVIVMPAGHTALGIPDGNVNATDLGNSGTVPASAGANTIGSTVIIGKIKAANARSFVVVGDSITYGQGDITGVGAMGGSGYPARLMERNGFGYLKIGMMGQQAADLAANKASVAALFAAINFSDAMFEHGVNDLRLGRTKDQILADHQTLYTMAGAARIGQATITPRADSSNAYADVAGQTPKTDGTMASLNDLNAAIRAKPTNVAYVIEAADAAMSARDSDVWSGPFPPTPDGTHPTSPKAAAMAAAISL